MGSHHLVVRTVAIAICTLLLSGGLTAWWAGEVVRDRRAIGQSATSQCGQSEGCSQEDLEAQVRMADATEVLVDVAFVQMWIGGFGLIFLGWTLIHTAKQASSAVDAARIAEETARHQLRAYVEVLHFHCIATVSAGEVTGYVFKVTLKNTGATPARRVCVSVSLIVTDDGDQIAPFSEPDTGRQRNAVIGSNCFYDTDLCAVRRDTMFNVFSKSQRIYVIGKCVYEDVFGQDFKPSPTRVTNFCAELHLKANPISAPLGEHDVGWSVHEFNNGQT